VNKGEFVINFIEHKNL